MSTPEAEGLDAAVLALQEAVTVRNLLDMASGIQWREWPCNKDSDGVKLWAAPGWTRFILEREVTLPPGEKFHYIAAAPHLLSAILTRSTVGVPRASRPGRRDRPGWALPNHDGRTTPAAQSAVVLRS